MKPSKPPRVIGVEVVATQPTEADEAAIAYLSEQAGKPLPQVTYLVKVRLKEIPPATSHGWALYLDDFRVPKYWEYKHGIYFKVFNPQFIEDLKGASLRFSPNGTDFIDTRVKLTVRKAAGKAVNRAKTLPSQEEALE